ncbi:MAG: glycogen/starch/alpha-glucan family phosphorylase, partial [Clostridia bacterium]|nr:glycogen/starch/alpha-glucan family phosphorylase [Clostridia bacterium]
VQLNDTHPVMAIPEIIRLLMADGLTFEEAFLIARDTCSYTNHTVMQEALEKWDLPLLASVCPEIVDIIKKIDLRFKAEMAEKDAPISATRCIIWPNQWNKRVKQVHMAQLAVYATHTTNGVAAIHTEILKDDVFADWYALYPERFQNKTNGITQRRWLGLCNPELTSLIAGKIGTGFLTDLYQLENLKPFINDDLCQDFMEVKKEKKLQLAAEIAHMEGVALDPNMIFDVQIKRLHEYKRQFMNALSILGIYYQLKEGKLPDFTPTAYIFGAKAAPGYDRAKAVIHLINMIADMVNEDPDTCDKLKVVFVQNYNVSWAEKLIPAADVSEQISPAGTEASGTGNMKLMLNGAVTLGTFDGANVEIVEQAGVENNYIFGATVEEINAIKATYDPKAIYKEDRLLARCLDALIDGTFPDEDGALAELRTSLLEGASWHAPDHYFILKDFASYMEAKLRVNQEYKDELAFARKCLMNVASAGKFSSDRTIAQYAKEIWKV